MQAFYPPALTISPICLESKELDEKVDRPCAPVRGYTPGSSRIAQVACSMESSAVALGPAARSPLLTVLAALGFAGTLGCGGDAPTPPLSPSPIPTVAPVPIPPGAPLSIVGGVANVTDRLLTEIALHG